MSIIQINTQGSGNYIHRSLSWCIPPARFPSLKQVCLFALVFLSPVLVSGQTNTDFWFAAPEVTSGHGDQPIYLRLTSFSQSAMVTVSEPSNTANFPTQNLYIPSNSTITINLTSLKEQVECKPANTILNFGLHIHSTFPITAYYEETHINNPEIFTLKGNNAMGTSFFIPSQDILYNHAPITPPAYNSFDIIATENNTTVTITPRKAIVGHAAGVPFVIVLNQGQVYSAQATGQSGTSHLHGSTVTSDKAVCITVKDDSDQYTGQECYDLTGDQIVPVNIIGQEYIVVRGYTNNTMNDWASVTATANGTTVNVNGTPAAVLNAGETYSYPLHYNDLSSYIQANHPVYVLHVTGYDCEAGSALLPPMNCTGSTQVAFTRTTQYNFELIILTKAGAQGSFTLDGNSTLVTAAMFASVTGNPAFVYARIEFPAATLPVGTHTLSNTSDIFHMGVIHTYDASQLGCSYGFFSDFASLNLGPDQTICPGTAITLDAGPNRQSYTWYYNGNLYLTGVQTITVGNPGLYSVTVNDHGCLLTDEVHLANYPFQAPAISGITSFCQGGSQVLSVSGAYSSYLWNTGATTSMITVSSSGTYGVTVTDANGCQGSTTVNVTVHPLPNVTLALPETVCSNAAPFPLTGGSPAGGVYSGPGVNSATGMFDPSSGTGPHLITYTYTDAFGCTGSESKTLMVNESPMVQLSAQPAVCISAPPFQLTGGTPSGGVYSGPGVNSATGVFTPSSGSGPHTITYTYTNAAGCTGSASAILTVNPLPIVQLAAQPSVCISVPPFQLTGGTPSGGIYSGTGVNPATGYFTPSSGSGPHTITYTYTNANGCSNASSRILMVYALPTVQLVVQPTVCNNVPPFQLTGGTPTGGVYSGPGVNSFTGFFDPSSGLGAHLITYTYTDLNGCTNAASAEITVNPAPLVQLPAQPEVCSSAPPFLLTGGTPGGGFYSGPGVNSFTGFFDPSSGVGMHLITYTYFNSSGCSGSASSILVVNPVPVVQLTDQPEVCISVPPFLLTGGTPEGGTYSGPGVTSFTGYFDPASGAGPHLISYTWTNANGCTNTAVNILTVNPLPMVQLPELPEVCISDPPFQLTGGTPEGGIYSGPGVNSTTGFFDPSSGLGPHLITYTFTDINGCTDASSGIINVSMLPEVSLTFLTGACVSAMPFPLSGGTPAGGIYSGPGVNSSTGYFDPSSGPGDYPITYTYTTASGCTSSASAVFTVNPLPIVQLGAQPVVCSSVAPFQLTGGTPPGGIYSGPAVDSSTGTFYPSSGPGPHPVTYSYTDPNGCTDIASVVLTVNPLPVVQLSGQPEVCISAPPFALSGGVPVGGVYSGAGVNSLTGFFDPASGPGEHLITYSYTDGEGCTGTDSKLLIVNDLPAVGLSDFTQVCITASPFTLAGGTPPGGIYSGNGVDPVTGFFNPPAAGAGQHDITYTYSSAASCVNTATKPLNVIPLPVPSGTITGPDHLCQASENIAYTLSGPDPLAISFNWEMTPVNAGAITGSSATLLLSLHENFTGSLALRFQPAGACGTGSFSPYTTISVSAKPEVSLQNCNDPVTTTGARPFLLKGGLPQGGIYSIDGLMLPEGILDPSILAPLPAVHEISYAYTDHSNCTASKTRSLTVFNSSAFSCNTLLTDVRDLKTYPTFAIVTGGIQRCWMAANLDYGNPVDDSKPHSDNCISEKYCPGNDPSACSLAGGLYQWDELMTYLPPDNASAESMQGLCPPEWHVATEAEWTGLINYFMGPALAGWGLLDPYPQPGFHAKPGGVFYQNSVWAFMPSGLAATMFWTSTVNTANGTLIFSHGLNDINPSVSTYLSSRNNAFPVRCVRD